MRISNIFYTKLFLAFVLIGFFLFLVYRVLLALLLVPDTGGIETTTIYFTQRCLDGNSLYTNPQLPPYSIAQYTPLYYYLLTLLVRLLNISSNDIEHIYSANRILSLVFNLSVSFLAIDLGRKVFSLSFYKNAVLGVFVFVYFEGFSRPDALSCFLWLLTLKFFITNLYKKKSRSFSYNLLLAILSLMAVLSKQSALTIVFIISGWMVYTRQYQKLLKYLGSFSALVAVMIIWMVADHQFDLVYKNIVLGLNNGFAPGMYLENFVVNFYLKSGLFITAALVVVISLFGKRQDEQYHFLRWALAAQFILSNLFALKFGSGWNYFTEWLVLLFIGIAVLSEHIDNALFSIDTRIGMIILILCLATRIFIVFPQYRKILGENAFETWRKQLETEKGLADFLTRKNGSDNYYVFSTVDNNRTFLTLLLRKQMLLPQLDIARRASGYPEKLFDYEGFKKHIEGSGVRFVISDSTDNRLKFYDVGFEKYQLDTVIGRYSVYGENK